MFIKMGAVKLGQAEVRPWENVQAPNQGSPQCRSGGIGHEITKFIRRYRNGWLARSSR